MLFWLLVVAALVAIFVILVPRALARPIQALISLLLSKLTRSQLAAICFAAVAIAPCTMVLPMMPFIWIAGEHSTLSTHVTPCSSELAVTSALALPASAFNYEAYTASGHVALPTACHSSKVDICSAVHFAVASATFHPLMLLLFCTGIAFDFGTAFGIAMAGTFVGMSIQYWAARYLFKDKVCYPGKAGGGGGIPSKPLCCLSLKWTRHISCAMAQRN